MANTTPLPLPAQAPALEIVTVRLYGTLRTNPVIQVRTVGVAGLAGHVKTFAKMADAKRFIAGQVA